MEYTVLRKPGPNEKRCIIRHNLGFYSCLFVGAVYLIRRDSVEESCLRQLDLYAPALIECINQHSYLSATIQNPASDDPVYIRTKQLDLRNHFRVLRVEDLKTLPTSSGTDEAVFFTQLAEHIHNNEGLQFTSVDSKPAWTLDVLPLPTRDDATHHRVFISFTYSHSNADGMSGVYFQQTFYKALQKAVQSKDTLPNPLIDTPTTPFPEQPDTPEKIPISITFLLRPLLSSLLPKFLSRLLGLAGSISGADNGTWTGSKHFTDTRTPRMKVTTSAELVQIDAKTLKTALDLCRKNGTKLTSLLNHLVARAMGSAFRASSGTNLGDSADFVSQTPVNLRRALGFSDGTIGNFAGGAYARHSTTFEAAPVDEKAWESLRQDAKHLANVASDTRNQPVGLFRFISGITKWMQGQIGKPRDCSWELSNLGSFNPKETGVEDRKQRVVEIEDVLFSQSASATGPPLTFNVASLRGGGLNIYITWQIGALALGSAGADGSEEECERDFVRRVAAALQEGLQAVGGTS